MSDRRAERFAAGNREPGACQWCHSPIWIVYHGPKANQTHEPRGSCEACDNWKREAEAARAEVTMWKGRLVRESERLRGLLSEVRHG